MEKRQLGFLGRCRGARSCLARRAVLRGLLALVTLGGIGRPGVGSAQPRPAAKQRIEDLLKAVESHDELKFIRNGKAYDSKDAASHLRQKLAFAGDRISTADQFIEHIASRSSQSGEIYRVRYPDGREEEAGNWLRAQLRKIDSWR